MSRRITILAALALLAVPGINAEKLPSFELDEAWQKKVAALAPESPLVEPKKPRKVLVFSLATGFQHWCIPHTEAVVRILGQTSGAYEIVGSTDIEDFRRESLRRYDALVLNNNCPQREKRDFFHDVLVRRMGEAGKPYADMPEAQRTALAKRLYRNLIDYVAAGRGLVLLHGAIANFTQYPEFSELAGGSFAGHPPQQEVSLIPVDPTHPIVEPFGGRPFVHIDEPYFHGGAYRRFLFKPLLELDRSKIRGGRRLKEKLEVPAYVAWIKRHEKGRVFFSSPSHNAQSFERPELLAFLLGGMQYALGDLDCDDAPLGTDAGK
jgi:type 1 glutamine amidotransferase